MFQKGLSEERYQTCPNFTGKPKPDITKRMSEKIRRYFNLSLIEPSTNPQEHKPLPCMN